MGDIITFYSYKGGVGRTMTIANAAVMLAMRGWRVLAVDWDLEAPGLHHYFPEAMANRRNSYGLMDLMTSASMENEPLDWRSCKFQCFSNGLRLDLLPSGVGRQGYETVVTKFDWVEFFLNHKGEQFLEDLRNQWLDEYDFVLIDSRTGITDTSGICTVFMPNILVLVLTANEQSLSGTEFIVKQAPVRRDQLTKSRSPLTFVPVISRWDGREEKKEAEKWLKNIQERLTQCVTDWFPAGRDISEIFLSLRLPHVAYFSFGEKLPVLTESTNDLEKPSFYYAKLAELLETLSDPNSDLDSLWRPRTNMRGWRKVILCGPRQELKEFWLLVKTLLQSHGIEVFEQDDFQTSMQLTADVLREVIYKTDAAIMLIGNQVGNYTAPSNEMSQFEVEYDLIQKLGKPLFTFVFKDDMSSSSGSVERSDAAERVLERIRMENVVSEFTDRFDLRLQLVSILSQVTRKIASTQLEKHAPRMFIGRETELAELDSAWEEGALNVYTLVAWGGAGKTSLVYHWVQTRFAAKGWPGVERYFDWSFYSQGTGESKQTSADLFIHKALEFFGDPDPTKGGPHERGERLAGLIRQRRTLLIIDGIDPLQYPPNDPQAGRLKDSALEALLRELASDNPGLLIITSRQRLMTVDGLASTAEQKLDKLSRKEGVALLRKLQIVGTDDELEEAWEYAGGHALTLSLLGSFIADAYEDRDIRYYREVNFAAADQEHQGRSAFKVMIAYERWLHSGGPERQRELTLLRLTGLFDRPMAKNCLQALRAEPPIPGLTDTLVNLTPQQWNIAVKRLSEVGLLSVSADTIDAHPLIREYFAAQLQRDQPKAFRAAHSRLFDFLCESTEHRPDSLAGLQPLFEAVGHGCRAGRQQEACENVFRDRILRNSYYSTTKLGAIRANLAATAAFFDEPWSQISPNLTPADQAWLLNQAAFSLRAVGRLTEALEPMRNSLFMFVQQRSWKNAAISASNLSEINVMLGRLPDALNDARQAITLADQSGDSFLRLALRNTVADALHQSGQRAAAGGLFLEAERMQKEKQPQFDLLYSLRSFQYCEWQLAPIEQAAWQHLLNQPISNSKPQIFDELTEIEHWARKAQAVAVQNQSLVDVSLDYLSLARLALFRAILEADPTPPHPTLNQSTAIVAVAGLRAAGATDQLPCGLLTVALSYYVLGEFDQTERYLGEAQQIAERGPMPLYLADIHLTRARLFRDRDELAKAAKLIRDRGYGRRYDELAVAEEVAKHWKT